MLVTANTSNNLVVITMTLDQAYILQWLLDFNSKYNPQTTTQELALTSELLPMLKAMPVCTLILKRKERN